MNNEGELHFDIGHSTFDIGHLTGTSRPGAIDDAVSADRTTGEKGLKNIECPMSNNE
jgi:hypothetical protein